MIWAEAFNLLKIWLVCATLCVYYSEMEYMTIPIPYIIHPFEQGLNHY